MGGWNLLILFWFVVLVVVVVVFVFFLHSWFSKDRHVLSIISHVLLLSDFVYSILAQGQRTDLSRGSGNTSLPWVLIGSTEASNSLSQTSDSSGSVDFKGPVPWSPLSRRDVKTISSGFNDLTFFSL